MFLAAVLVYLGLLALAGLWRARRLQTGDDFLVAGRTLPARVLVFTLLATWIGSGSLFGGAGLGYRVGFPALWQSAGAWVGIALIYFIAPRVRRIALYTVPDILELRYGPAARVLGTLTIVIAYTTIAAYQFRGGGRLLSLVAEIDPGTGALITAAFCVLYTAMAGMLSVAYLDIANGVMMTAGVGLAVGFLVAHAGGPGPALAALRPDQVSLFGRLDPVSDALALFLPTMFLLLGEANMYQKFFSARNEWAARYAVVGWIAGTVLVETLIDSVGVFGSVVVPGLDTAQSEAIVIRVAVDVLPRVLGILLVCGAAAIIVSTANSFLLTPATNLMRDVYQRFVNPRATDRQVLLYTRLLVLLLGAAGFVSLQFFTTILQMALWAYTMYGAVITPPLLAAFVWPRATRQGAVAAMAVGMIVTIGWETYAKLQGTTGEPIYPLGLPTIYPALVLSVLILLGVSLVTTARPGAERLAAGRS
ncbi:MAG TPA: sodium:solute symporter family protein [Vicinamibacterales bacterium]|nr:sodium:solute symporter family protein [Vicinamibacterales bacterium]